MKKNIIITTSVALALLLSSTTAFARGGHDNDGDNEDGDRRGGRSSQFVSNATDTAQLLSLQQQIENLSRQLEELKRGSQVNGNSVKRQNEDDRRSNRQVCNSFKNKHRHWGRNRGNHFGFAFDQSVPERCKKLPGFGTSTTPVVDAMTPIISAIGVSAITSTSATVNWNTNEDATSKIFISTTSPVLATGTPAWQDATFIKAHGVQLNGLIPSTTYYFVITNTDASSNTVTSVQGTFLTTALVVDTTGPVISAIAVSNITTTGATLAWNTNEGATSKVYLGTTSPVSTSSATITDVVLLTTHTAPLTTLLPGTTYFFVIQATDAALNTTYAVQGSFTTAVADTVAPIISAVGVSPVSSTTATVTWTTNELANSTVYYSSTTPVVIATALTTTNAVLVTAHSTGLSGLTASTTYYVIVASKDAANNLGTSSQTSFTTSN